VSSLERSCGCGGLYFATSPYDYSCPACFQRECREHVRAIEWVGGFCPPGTMAIEITPITATWEQARDFAVNYLVGIFYSSSPFPAYFMECCITRFSKTATRGIVREWITDTGDWHATHTIDRLLEPAAEDGWWWLNTEHAWTSDPEDLEHLHEHDHA
jgi:hypothetical protein